jgi:hypothetical protein
MSNNQIIHDILEDFIPIGTPSFAALLRRDPHCEHFAENVWAAAVASSFALKSLDYARRQYDYQKWKVETGILPTDLYIEAYQFTNSYVRNCIASVNTEGKPEPSVGVFGAAVVLTRLPSSFFCAHLMYQLGHTYEGHAISRLILEQLAWAYAAFEAQDVETVKRIRTTKTFSRLTSLVPQAGELYGFLSKKTHIDYSIHPEFLSIDNGTNAIIQSDGDYVLPEYGSIILLLGDLFGLVLEASQFQYIVSPQAIEQRQGTCLPKPDREYLLKMQEYLNNILQAVQQDHPGLIKKSREISPILRIFREWSTLSTMKKESNLLLAHFRAP